MKLHHTPTGVILEDGEGFFRMPEDWDTLIDRDDLPGYLRYRTGDGGSSEAGPQQPLAPIGSQEVWAAGVTYFRSRTARMEESQGSGGGTFYDSVYAADRPELFFKSAAWRVRGPDQTVRIRRDARWSVPEPELALCINSRAEIVGYTIGNDVSSRDIEGENPLYLPQAKVYDGSCALGPAVLVADGPLPADMPIEIRILRGGSVAFQDETALSQMRRTPEELVEFLYRETSFPHGCVLLTGTGIVPPDEFTLRSGDEVRITIPPIGTLVNPVE